MDASEIHSKRPNAKEVMFPKENGKLFPAADGRINLIGKDQELITSTLIRERPLRGESHVDFLGESEGSPPPLPPDSLPVKQEMIFGPFRKLHSPSSRGTESQTARGERRFIPNSTEMH